MPDLTQARRGVLEGIGGGMLSLVAPMSRLIYRGRISTVGRVAAAFAELAKAI